MSRSKGKLLKINPGMTKQKVIKTIGKPNAVRASNMVADDFRYEVHEYILYGKADGFANFGLGLFFITLPWWTPGWTWEDSDEYWFHYVNEELRLWGEAGDWTGAPKEIIEYRIKTGHQINLK